MTSPRLMWFVGCEGIALDQMTGRVTAFNILDTVLVSELPSLLNRLACAACYEPGDVGFRGFERVRVVGPSNGQVSLSRAELVVPARGPTKVHKSLHVIWALPIREQGTHRILLEHSLDEENWTEQASLVLEVLVQPHPLLNQQLP